MDPWGREGKLCCSASRPPFLRCDVSNTPILAVQVERHPAALSGHHVSKGAPVKSTCVSCSASFGTCGARNDTDVMKVTHQL